MQMHYVPCVLFECNAEAPGMLYAQKCSASLHMCVPSFAGVSTPSTSTRFAPKTHCYKKQWLCATARAQHKQHKQPQQQHHMSTLQAASAAADTF
jgi:hypothetical protein